MKPTKGNLKKFQNEIWNFYRKNGRQFPWRPPMLKLRRDKGETTDSYKVLVSEVMLQQTQAGRVVPKYLQFIERFPNFSKLSKVSLREVLSVWQGLGYNRRAISLKKIAEIVTEKYEGLLPQTLEELDDLPGIGKASASSIMAFAWNKPTAFIETNIRRVYIHFFFLRKRKINDKNILLLVKKTLDSTNPREWYCALMDYGAMLATKVVNPNRYSAHYQKQAQFKGSNREVRGAILKFMTAKNRVDSEKLLILPFAEKKIMNNLAGLIKEGFLKREGKNIKIA